jgi:hypothetical protein
MKRPALSVLVVALGICGISFTQAQSIPARRGNLVFVAAGTNGFDFDTGILKGKLRAGGKSTGLSSVVHLPSGLTLDHSKGLFGHYRVFSTNKRYGTAAWDWPSEARLRPDGSVEVRWPSTEDRPFELSAVYRWAAPVTLDLETTVHARTNLPHFESFIGSYFGEGFTNASVYARSNGQPGFEPAVEARGAWQAFPRDNEAVGIIQDGRWKFPANPVDWVIQPELAKPLGLRRCPAKNVQALLMSPPSDCFAVLTPFEAEPHRSMYLSLFGKDLKAGESATARARLIISPRLPESQMLAAYERYLEEVARKGRGVRER